MERFNMADPVGARAKSVLAIGAHLDDAILGAGALLLEASRAGARVTVVTLVSDFSSRLATRGQEQATTDELLALAHEHGWDIRLMGQPYHRLDPHDLPLKQQLARIALEAGTDVALIHHDQDHWPDHVAAARLGFDAVMFTHGLTDDMRQRYCPLVYAFSTTARQTHTFEPDVFFDVQHVMGDYLDLVRRVDAIAQRRRPDDLDRAHFALKGSGAQAWPLSEHGLLRLADCLRWGDLAGCRLALGLRTVWGDRRGPQWWKAASP
jgi:LmbE family N-acetylglucosaminyl deacetylase